MNNTVILNLEIEDVKAVTTIGCDQQMLNCSIGSTHNCTYMWIDGSNSSDSSPTLYLRNKPNGKYSCISECHLRGVSCSTLRLNIDRQCPNGMSLFTSINN